MFSARLAGVHVVMSSDGLIDFDQLIRDTNHMEPLPASVARLATLVSREDSTMGEIAEVIQFDPAMTANLLRAANSTAAGGKLKITNVRDAVLRMGTGIVLSLAVGFGVRRQFNRKVSEYGMTEGELWRHAVASSLAAELSSGYCGLKLPPETSTAALLHDIGKLVLSRYLKPDIQDWLKRATQEGHMNRLQAEREILNVHHGELGGLLAQRWQLPDSIVKGIIYHHTPEESGALICDGVFLANEVAKQIGTGRPDLHPPEQFDAVLDRLMMTRDKYGKLCEATADKLKEVGKRYE